MTIFALPSTILCHSSKRSPPLRWLCRTATSSCTSAKRLLNRPTVCGGQRDLRNEHQRGPAGIERGGDRLQVDFGLPAPGDTVQQHRPVGGRIRHGPLHRGETVRLGSRQGQWRRGDEDLVAVRVPADDFHIEFDQPLLHQAVDRRAAAGAETRDRERFPRRQQFGQDRRLAFGAPFQGGQLFVLRPAGRRDELAALEIVVLAPHRLRDQAAHDRLHRRTVVVGNPASQFDQCLGENRPVADDRRDRLQVGRPLIPRTGVTERDHRTGRWPIAQRHAHPRSDHHGLRELGGELVVELESGRTVHEHFGRRSHWLGDSVHRSTRGGKANSQSRLSPDAVSR